MQTNILWAGIEYESLEHCQATASKDGINIDSIIVGRYNGQLYRVVYTLTLDTSWQVKLCAIKATVQSDTTPIVLEKKTDGWWLNGQLRPDFENCTDIDIPLTPLTNSLPIHRLKLQPGEEREIEVAYIDLLKGSIGPVKQKYRRTGLRHYHYENIPNDFEAEITVDSGGFVTDYPGLFVSKAGK